MLMLQELTAGLRAEEAGWTKWTRTMSPATAATARCGLVRSGHAITEHSRAAVYSLDG